MDLDGRAREKDTGLWDEMLPKVTEHPIQVTNLDVRRKAQAATGECDELLTLVKKRKPRLFANISRSSGLAKTILQSTVQGKRRKGRQKRWEDRTRWIRIVVKSSVAPQQRPVKIIG